MYLSFSPSLFLFIQLFISVFLSFSPSSSVSPPSPSLPIFSSPHLSLSPNPSPTVSSPSFSLSSAHWPYEYRALTLITIHSLSSYSTVVIYAPLIFISQCKLLASCEIRNGWHSYRHLCSSLRCLRARHYHRDH